MNEIQNIRCPYCKKTFEVKKGMLGKIKPEELPKPKLGKINVRKKQTKPGKSNTRICKICKQPLAYHVIGCYHTCSNMNCPEYQKRV